MNKQNLFYEELQKIFKYYIQNDDYLSDALYAVKKYERRSFISSILSYEYKNLVENKNLKLNEKYKAILPPNLIAILEYDKKEFKGAILNLFIDDLKFELEHIEMELYDDPADFEGGDYYNEESDCDEDYTVSDWVEDKVANIKDFLYALEDFKWNKS